MHRSNWITGLIVAIALGGCANGGPGDATPDAGGWTSWGDASSSDCYSGEHLCAGECVEDYPNDPEHGCRDGCGEPCTAPEGATATCTADGRCDFECEAPREKVGDRCECVPLTCAEAGASCGPLEDGCGGTLDCGTCADGTACVDGSCGCPPDEGEGNDVQATAHDLGEVSDQPRAEVVVDTFSLHSRTDVDWFELRVHDALDASNPDITVTLADAAPGYIVGAWYVCDSGVNSSVCEQGEHSTVAGRGCSAPTDGTGATTMRLQGECGGWNEDGTLLVRVMASAALDETACTPYRLGVVVD